MAAWSALCCGLVASTLGGWAWSRTQDEKARSAFANTASIVHSSIAAQLQRNLDFQTSFGQLISVNTAMTNQEIGKWLVRLNLASHYSGMLGIGYYQQVSASQLADYQAAITADPVPGLGPGPYTIYPPGSRSSYCLIRLGLAISPNGFASGSDLCSSASPSSVAASEATRSGRPQFFGDAAVSAAIRAQGLPLDLVSRYRDTVVGVSPVYAGGIEPTTYAARAAKTIGWVVSSFNGAVMFRAALAGASGLTVSLTSRAQGLITSVGVTTKSNAWSSTRTFPANSDLSLTVSEPQTGFGAFQGLGVALLGALFSALLFAFLFHLGRSRDRALHMVDERTGELRHLALHDALTDLPNRALLFDRADQMLTRGRRHQSAVAALFVDLDNFKEVNDTFGHDTGDELLKAVAARLQSVVRESDTVGRLGGDEFLVLTDDDTTDAGPELLAERIIAVLDQPFDLSTPEPISLNVRASIGIAAGLRETSVELIRDADVALYQAKEAGKGMCIAFRPEMQRAVHDRMSLEIDLHGALSRGELFVVYQPIFDLSSMIATGVEALVRWNHPERGVIAPGEFIPLAEQSGMITQIGAFVLDEACAQAASWHHSGYEFQMSVNVSAVQFRLPGFVDDIRAALERHEIPARVLILEITESMLMRDMPETLRTLDALKALGVSIAIDDFGTGYSSMAYLRQFPIDSLKIDRSFISRATESPQATAILHILVQLGKALGIETLAEGIEQQPQLDRLQAEECDSGQGFLFARPLPPGEIIPFLARTKAESSGTTVS